MLQEHSNNNDPTKTTTATTTATPVPASNHQCQHVCRSAADIDRAVIADVFLHADASV